MLRTVLRSILWLSVAAAIPSHAPIEAAQKDDDSAVMQAFAKQGVGIDRTRGLCSIPVDVCIRDALLEYMLVGPGGAAHESLFSTSVAPSVLNAALILLGAEPGSNANWYPKDPRPSDADLEKGVSPWVVELPKGFSFYLYAGWKQGGETYFFRVEDLLRDLSKGRGMQRHKWVYLGSRMVAAGDRDHKEAQAFAADLYQNVINISYFPEGFTVLTAALAECVEQTIWMPNAWLLPDRGEHVRLFFSKERLDTLPADLAANLPEVAPPHVGGGR